MRPEEPCLPSSSVIRAHVLGALHRYWAKSAGLVEALPVTGQKQFAKIDGPLRLVLIKVPAWAASAAVDGHLLVPQEAVKSEAGSNHDWQQVDWWLAAFLLLEGWHERVWEARYGPIHSYSYKLADWDERVWEHAWVNRIALFLRAWAVKYQSAGEQQLGALPKTEILMTHDVDALRKTVPIRLKQGAFNLFNVARAVRKRDMTAAKDRLRQAYRFLFGQEDWWCFDQLLEAEKQANVSAVFHFHADHRRRNLKRWLFDPGYNVDAPACRDLLQQLREAGHEIGVHPGFDAWQDPGLIEGPRDILERVAQSPVTHCRQHWLRFSWRETWIAQTRAGITHDTTLMFNDRPGYRTSSALSWRPWDPASKKTEGIIVRPTVLMDSHCYDYQPMTAEQRLQSIRHWLGECQTVRGQVAILWHPHTLSEDYGWLEGFQDTLNVLSEVAA